ncbi:Lon protease family protein [Paramaledivibacter caminithermalis]|uniref:endopeptidase La n=1 Tax=Paramaledivibacter caminithermalis (strain DSM 15212 / CIP 107654 / DViRD3) TaxID=1121301 RepID=A0A1M6KTL6_PARC5|nr:ATP-binding protein [Paramaledivibacter caminithermalis]SHJ62321.1 lon-related putative ATP-dependent protease [Paramaledivibacter caminithermalis DSM 15212]
MQEKLRLPYNMLKKECNTECFEFNSTADLTPLQGIIGQERASKALDFGLSIKKKGYNIFVSGQSGTGRNSYVKLITEEKASKKKVPDDWVYVYNFKNPHSPMALNLNTGQGKELVKDMEDTITKLKKEIENAFTSKDYENMRSVFIQQYQSISQQIINDLNKVAAEYDFRFTLTEKGLISVPLRDGKPMSEADYSSLSPEEFEILKEKSNKLSLESVDVLNKLREIEEEYRDKIKELDIETATKVVDFYIEKLKTKFNYNDKIIEYFDMLKEDIIEHIDRFKKDNSLAMDNPLAMFQIKSSQGFFDRYKVNLFIDNSEKKCAPVIIESNPTYYNLVGSVEYKNEMGVMKTDFTQIKPGALHEANGGYLILQAKDVLTNPFAWNGLKRALITGEINIEGLGNQFGYVVTASLRPQPIPINLKVILIGDPYTYYLLYNYDEQFKKLFKIMSDFDIEMTRDKENMLKMARFIAAHCEKEDIRHFDYEAVGRVIEYSSRLAANQKKLSSRFNQIVELLYEADSWAEVDESDLVRLKHVEKAISEKIFRNNKYEEKVLEMFKEGDYLLDVEGEKIGEINGLAVTGTGEYSFGKPSKITVSTYRGKAGIINIEREAKTSGKIHDKGVMIISGYLGYKYAQEKPLALSASIVFEQLYSGVDGDSASSTELYAILSSISKVPIKQYIAVTGSVNQRGEIQPIGGVNEKIEGFFKVCKLKGLTGKQGVMIPHQNVKNLMLSNEVIEAVKEGKFHIYAVKTIDEGIEILTGIPAGQKDEKGEYPRGTIHYKITETLNKYAKAAEKEETNNAKEEK